MCFGLKVEKSTPKDLNPAPRTETLDLEPATKLTARPKLTRSPELHPGDPDEI